MKTHIVYIGIIVFLLGFLYIGKGVNKGQIYREKYTVIEEKIDTQYIEKRYNVYRPGKNIFHDTTIYVKVPYLDQEQIDSIEQEYFALNTFRDTITIDSATIYIKDTIQMNKIKGRSVYGDFKYPVVTKEKYLSIKPKTQVYFGPKVDVFGNKNLNSVGVGLVVKSPKDRMVELYVNRSMNGIMIYGGGLYIKL